MKRKLLWVVPVLLALGLIMAGCAGPASPVGAPVSRSEGGLGIGTQYKVDGGGTPTLLTVKYSDGTVVGGNHAVQFVIKDSDGNAIGTAFCGDINTPFTNGESPWSTVNYEVVPLSSYISNDKALELKAALTYLVNNYPVIAENLAFYQAAAQGIIWSIVNDVQITNFEGWSWWPDGNGGSINVLTMPGADQVMIAINDTIANLGKIVTDYNTHVALDGGSASLAGNMYGPYSVSMDSSLFPGIMFDLGWDQGTGTFVNADGEAITQVAPGQDFYVQVAPGATGDFRFTASASADSVYKIVNDITLLYAIPDARDLAANPAYQPLFQPLFQPLLGSATQSYFYSASASFNIAPVTGDINIIKNVDGINISVWAAGKDINSLISFDLYLGGAKVGTSGVDSNGMISFKGLADGTYTVKEVLSPAGALVFKQAPDMQITIAGGKPVSADGFDASATFDSVIPYQGADMVTVRVNLADGLVYNSSWNGTITGSFDNPYFEDFHVKAADGSSYSSYCAAWYSDNLNQNLINFDRFAGAKGAADKANIIQALNYIIANWGSLDQWPVGPGANTEAIPQNATKLISQMVVYKLLDDGVTSTEVLGAQAWVNEYVNQVLNSYSSYNGPAFVSDVAFLAKINFVVGQQNLNQPQLVPIYSNVINNVLAPPPSPALGPSQSSVTATNAGNVPQILAGLNPKNGNPYYGDKNNPDTPFVVPNSNHFVYAQFTRDQLLAGQDLDFVVGNNYTIVGKGFVQLDGNNNLVITIDGKGSFGALAFSSLPAPKNGNIQSVTKAADAAAWGASAGFSFNSQGTIPCPKGDTIWLYIDCDSFQFYPVN